MVDRSLAIRNLDRPRHLKLAELAARQHGVVATRQLNELGFSTQAIHRAAATGRLHRLYRGVYAVGHAVVSRHGRWTAAVLACGPDAVLSHRDAAALWQLRRSERAGIDVTAPGRSRRGRRGITLHSVRHLDPRDRTVRDGIPVTTVARTLLDLAEVLTPRRLKRAYEEAERLRLFDLRAVKEVCARSNGRHGVKPLNALIDSPPRIADTRSELESRFLDLCEEARLPPPQVNVALEGFTVDTLWPRQRLVVELDGRAYHRTRAAFEHDRMRDAALQVAGYRVVRVTARRLETDPDALAATLRTLLG